jgi:hypothetical protein
MAINRAKKDSWEPIEIRIEAGGANYGLLPIEAGNLLGLSDNVIGAAIFWNLINKGIAYRSEDSILHINSEIYEILKNHSLDDHSKRISISKHLQILVQEYEYMALQTIFPDKLASLDKIKLDIVFKFIRKSVVHRMSGYSFPETKTYYLDLIQFIIDRGGWSNSSKKKEWKIIKKALDLDPELGIEEMIEILLK